MQALRDHGQDFLVGNRLSWADVQLLEVILMAEECEASVLSGFPLLQVMLQCKPSVLSGFPPEREVVLSNSSWGLQREWMYATSLFLPFVILH